MEGASPQHIRLRVADGVELTTGPVVEPGLIESLGLEAAVRLERADGLELTGISRLVGA
jgi:hypothetical protein